MDANEFLAQATSQVQGIREDLELCMRILELREEIRAFDLRIASAQAELEAFTALPHGGRMAGCTQLLGMARRLQADVIRLRSHQIPLVDALRRLELLQDEAP
jgi:hypothetical protein